MAVRNVGADEALRRLREGNARFAANVRGIDAFLSHTRRAELARGQRPFAIVLGCSDSRVPAEIVFDQGLGDLFVVRVAGNIVAPSLIGSVELAATRFGTRLVVVLGHSRCGAVLATLDAMREANGVESANLGAIYDKIRPFLAPLLAGSENEKQLVELAVRANVLNSVAGLRRGSPVLDRLAREDGLRIVGAEYSLDTGEVEFLEDSLHD